MKRCITCYYWILAAAGQGLCEVQNITRLPGCSCSKHKACENKDRTPWRQYLEALIGREKAEVGSPAHELFCAEVDSLYKQLDNLTQFHTHDAFRAFMENPNVR